MSINNYTGERLETFIYNQTSVEHLHRYSFASSRVKGKVVLDIACGEGYGSNFLSLSAAKVYGIDIDANTISRAKEKYHRDNIEFLTGSTSKIPLDDNSIDIVISFETLEHHNEHDEMFIEMIRVLKPNGIIIVSTPDKYYYSDVRNFNNSFHVKELYKQEFIDLVSKYFSNSIFFSQIYTNGISVLMDLEKAEKKIEFYHGDFQNVRDFSPIPKYLIAVASNVKLEKLNNSIFDGMDVINKGENLLKDQIINEIYKSTSYKLGNTLVRPFFYLKKIFKKNAF